jgi:hypothetical protein
MGRIRSPTVVVAVPVVVDVVAPVDVVWPATVVEEIVVVLDELVEVELDELLDVVVVVTIDAGSQRRQALAALLRSCDFSGRPSHRKGSPGPRRTSRSPLSSAAIGRFDTRCHTRAAVRNEWAGVSRHSSNIDHKRTQNST